MGVFTGSGLAAAGRAVRAQRPVCDARYRLCGVFRVSDVESVPFVAPASPFGGSGHPERADAVRHGTHPVRQPHPPNARRHSAGTFRRRVFGDRCGSGGIRDAVGHAVSGWACADGVGRFAAFPIQQAALRSVPDAPCGRRDGVLPQLCLCVDGRTGPTPGPAVGTGVRASPGRDRQAGPREPRGAAVAGAGRALRGRAAAGPFGRRSLRPPCEAVRAAGGNLIFVCKPSSRRTLGKYLQGAVPQEIRRTAGRGSGKHLHRYR